MTDITSEMKTLVTILRHQAFVRICLEQVARQLLQRANSHDLSKLSDDEFSGFVEINQVAREHKYGSPEYMESIKNNNAVSIHYSRNPHHPEHHLDGINDMSLIDIVEMVADWKAASITYNQSSLAESVEVSRERFGITDEQMYLVNLVVEIMDSDLGSPGRSTND